MIEKRTMWIVERNLHIHQVDALYDLDKREVIAEHYSGDGCDDDDWYHALEGERFFNTEQEAREHRAIRIEEAREKMKTCMALIEELDELEPAEDFEFEQKDYLGGYADRGSRHGYYFEMYQKYEKKASLLSSIARSRHFNVNGETVNIDEVVRILWHPDNQASLVLRDGKKIITNNDIEFSIVTEMFGSNRSGMIVQRYSNN